MTGISDRIAAVITAHDWYTTGQAAFRPGVYGCQGCSGREFSTLTAHAAHVAEAIEQHLGLHEEWGVVAPTGHARTASTAEGARWLRDQRGYTARHHFVTGWTEEGKETVAQHQN